MGKAGSTHNVSDFAPPGYKLVGSHYENGGVRHVFQDGNAHLECIVSQHDDEEKALAAFRAAHTPEPTWAEHLAAHKDLIAADTLPAPAAKPKGKRLDK